MIHRDAVGERVRASGIFGNIAANGAGFLAGRIGSKVQTQSLGRGRKIEVYDARLNNGALIGSINFKNAVHARESQNHGAIAGESSAA